MRGGRSSFLGVALVLAGTLASRAAASELAGAEFVGPESCNACHPDAFAAWLQSKHARSIESLSEQQQKDARCLSCHSPNLQDRRVASVSCETCHGGGQYYAAGYVMKDEELVRLVGLQDPSEKGCRSCHDASSPSLRPFDFTAKLKLIDHWTAERQRRERKADASTGAEVPAPLATPAKVAPPPGGVKAPAATTSTGKAPARPPAKSGTKPKPGPRRPKKP